MKLKLLFLTCTLASCTLSALPIQSIAGLTGVRVYEVSNTVNQFTFAPTSAAILNRINATLTNQNADFSGAQTEFYDVFYSDSNGAFNANGAYVTVAGDYANSGLGFNIAEVQLLFGNNPGVFASTVTAFNPGVGYVTGNQNNAIDGNTNTFTSFGITDETRMFITLGFDVPAPNNTGVPEPSSWILGLAGLAGVMAMRIKTR